MSKLKSLIGKNTKADNSAPLAVTSDSKNTDNTSLDMTSKSNTPIEQTRWNGWGNVSINKKVSPHGAKLIKSHIGKTKKLKSVSMQQVLKTLAS